MVGKRFYLYMLCGGLALGALGCGEETDDKGAEEEPLTDGKSDSFFRPTEHGPMRFEVANPATIQEDERFHAWTFEVGEGEAKIVLKTEVSRNLDTVMYLYHRTDPEESWGRYIKKNDDHGDDIWSQIERDELEAGEYRVIVKPFKKALSGDFSLLGTCEGDGCPSAGTDVCSPDEVQSIPTYTQWSSSCASKVFGVLNSQQEYSTGGETTDKRRCDLNGIELLAVDHTISYWNDIVGFREAFDWHTDDDGGIPLEFDITLLDHGVLASVDAPGDESGLSLVYDNDNNLLAVYQHNQSPIVDFFCADEGEAPVEGPSEDCFQQVMWNAPHGDDVGSDGGLLAIEDMDEHHPGLGVAGAKYAEQFDITDLNTEVAWDLLIYDGAVMVHMGDDPSRSYFVTEDWRNEWAIQVEAGPNGVDWTCGE